MLYLVIFSSETASGQVEVQFNLGSVNFYDEPELQAVINTAVNSGQIGSFSVVSETPQWVKGEVVAGMV